MKTMLRQGHMAKVYIEDQFAYKIYDDFYPEEWVDKEIYIHDILKEKTSLSVTEMQKVDAHEIKMPYLGTDLLNLHIYKNYDDSMMADFVHLQSEIHTYSALELENAHIVYKRWLEMSQLSKEIKQISLSILGQLEYKNHLCHFDYQPSHVARFNEKYYIMDWIHAKLGHPILDVAQSYILLRLNDYKIAQKYLYKAVDMMDLKKESVYQVVPLMAAIKMIETDDIYDHKVLTTLVYDPKNKDVTK